MQPVDLVLHANYVLLERKEKVCQLIVSIRPHVSSFGCFRWQTFQTRLRVLFRHFPNFGDDAFEGTWNSFPRGGVANHLYVVDVFVLLSLLRLEIALLLQPLDAAAGRVAAVLQRPPPEMRITGNEDPNSYAQIVASCYVHIDCIQFVMPVNALHCLPVWPRLVEALSPPVRDTGAAAAASA